MKDAIAVVLFVALCISIAWMHANTEVDVTICQAHGNMLILEPQELRDLELTMDLSELACSTSVLRNSQLWKLRAAYKRASGKR